MVTQIVIEVLIGVLSIVGNGVVLIIIFRHHHLQTVTNVLIASLALADLLVGVLGVPVVIVALFGLPANFYGCLLLNCVIITLTHISIFTLLSVAIEQGVAVRHPFFYQQHFSVRSAIMVAVVDWLLGILTGLIPVFRWNNGWNPDNICAFMLIMDLQHIVYFDYVSFILVPLVIMFAIYCYIFMVVKKQANQIAALQVSNHHGDSLTIENSTPSTTQGHNIRHEMKAAKKFSLVIGMFALCWLPLVLMNMVFLPTGLRCFPCIIIAVCLSHANSAINPFLYAYGNSALRAAMKKTILCKWTQIEDATTTYFTA